MMHNPHNDDFSLFPYRADYSDGRTNNGGINLVEEPHRIKEITEARTFPELRDLLIEVNNENSPFITLGCEATTVNSFFMGYIEFSLRPEYAKYSTKLLNLDSQFIALVKQLEDPKIDWEKYCAKTLKWESAKFAFKLAPEVTQHKVTVWYQFNNQQEAATFISAFHMFLMDYTNIPASDQINILAIVLFRHSQLILYWLNSCSIS